MGFTTGDIRYSINARYLDGYENLRPLTDAVIKSGYTSKIDSFLVFDIGATMEFLINDNDVLLGLHLINAFDESAPLLYDAPDFSFDTRLHDPRGRLLNLSIDLKF